MEKISRRFKKRVLFTLSILVIIGSVLFISFNNTYDFKVSKNLDIFFNLFREISLYYVDDTDPEKLIKESIDGMLKSLDPYTVFIPESEMQNFEFQTTGVYGGVGALIRKVDDYVIISEPYEGFPADIAGLKSGDRIIKINGESIKGKELKEVSDMLKGTPNSECKITIEKPISGEIKKIVLIRKEIKISNVPYFGVIDDKTGYIRISGFTKGAHNEVKEALLSLKEKNNIKSLVIDLRENPGGLLIEAVEIANLFVSKDQKIVSTIGKVKQWDNTYITDKEPVDTLIPLIVLVSRGSASASEIVSGALQDLDRAVIIGQRTFGKGLVQTTRPLSFNTQLKVTTAKYYIPSGRCIQALDYSNRNEDGSVGHIPDSLISEYSTKNGRKVYDGGGIVPDIKIESEQYGKITTSLFAKNLIFDYATQFVYHNSSIGSVNKFQITDSIYNDFISFLQDKEYDYQTKSEEKLEELVKIAKQEKYYELSKNELDTLKLKLAHDKNKDLQVFKNEICELIKQEICSRYYYQSGRVEASIENDPYIDSAILVLNNFIEYNDILANRSPGEDLRALKK
ncbi:MAG: S41 family peptidase [Bacteroidales bacterium]|nr:S41 family peptidase [Bacteroidales bacterium]